MAKYQKDIQRKQCKVLKNGQKFNPSTSWLDYKKESRKKNSKDLDQMGDNWYSVPLSEYDIPDSFPNDLDELLWDKDVFDFMSWQTDKTGSTGPVLPEPDFVTGTGSYQNRFYRKFPMVPSGPLVTGLEPVWTGPEPVLTGSFMYQ
ncbi:hypothetical protein H5410_028633 [Solanum commersonii]|uniref:Uncharacterized protein n=1 Tax=Solanum commersonii TaxID=4109 RepID=A0A9J5Z4J6_SOLCO|nr:hypothetical protein H5410_028633 [Solanum commersonii]